MTIQEQETDSPIIPVPQLERLHAFKPEAVDWVLQQTQIEAETRRSEIRRINLFTFIERVLGQIFGLLIGLSGIFGGGYIALHGEPWAGVSIAGVTIGSLAIAFITGRKGK
jgi:uncharacterized membrane protein